ncbi:hypothetical protein HGM15179_018824 [Zosterops borbonicus]|uniref:Uncharacterized protein n=1 Tax=Zosterops borbonicus TaxID=364589 RepID=A0A8K1DC44_9PASS|nr:hypothetical protein HGM15179_018824 [Zosterops borbonicus]
MVTLAFAEEQECPSSSPLRVISRGAPASSESLGTGSNHYKWEDPCGLITWGCGYASVSTDTGYGRYPQGVFTLTCNIKTRMWPTGNIRVMIRMPIVIQTIFLQVENEYSILFVLSSEC